MPQMKPLNWLMLMTFFLSIYMNLLIKFFFQKFFLLNKVNKLKINKTINFKFSW